MSLLEAVGLTVDVGAKALVRDLSFDLGEGEMLGLIGPNGAGKTTVVKAIVQLMAHRGEIRLQGRALSHMSARERARRVAYLSQDDRLQWPISVFDLVALGRHPYRGSWWRGGGAPSAEDLAVIEQALQATDVTDLRARRADELSGGERARARLARVLAVQAPLLLADEPVAALDPMHQLRVMELLRDHCRRGAGVIVVMHDLTLASRFCDRLLLLDRGAAVAAGAVSEVLTAENLERVYGIRAVTGEHERQPYIIPWTCAAAGSDGAETL